MKRIIIISLIISLFLVCSAVFSEDIQEVPAKIKQLQSDYYKLKNDIQAEEQRLDMLIDACLQCKQPKIRSKNSELEARLSKLLRDLQTVEQMIQVIDNKIQALKQEIEEKNDELKRKKRELREKQGELIQKKAELEDKMTLKDELWKKLSQDQVQTLQTLYSQLMDSLNSDNYFSALAIKKDIKEHEEEFKIQGYFELVEDVNFNLPKSISELEQKIRQLNTDIQNLPTIISSLKTQLSELSSARNNFLRIRTAVIDLQIELAKLKEKVKTLEKLLTFKKQEEKNPEKENEIKEKMQEEVKKLEERKEELERIKKKLIGLINKKNKEKNPEKKKKLEEKIKSIQDKEGLIPTPTPQKVQPEEPAKPEETPVPPKPTKDKDTAILTPIIPGQWEIIVKWFHTRFNMTAVNDYIKWINDDYQGTIDEIISGNGVSIEIIYNLNSSVGLGFSYEHIWTSAEGNLTNSWPPPNTLTHKQNISADGFLGITKFTISESVNKFNIRGVIGAGVYSSGYKETENGYSASGTGLNFGYKVGVDFNYYFTKNFGICGEASYRGIKINKYENSTGNTLKYVSTYGDEIIKCDLSGIGISLGIFLRL